MQSSSAKDARKSSVGAAAVRNATGSVNSVVSNGNGGAISRRPVTAAAIIVPAKKNPPLATITNQPRKMDYNQQQQQQQQTNLNNNGYHCHQSVVGVKTKTLYEGSCDATAKGSKLKAPLNGGEVIGHQNGNGRLVRDAPSPEVMTTNGQHPSSQHHNHHHHHQNRRDALENVMPLSSSSNLNSLSGLGNGCQRYFNGQPQNHVLCNENGGVGKKEHNHNTIKPKEQHQSIDNNSNSGSVHSNIRRVRNRSESSEPVGNGDAKEAYFMNGGGRNAKVPVELPAGCNGANEGIGLGQSKVSVEDNTLKRSREDSAFSKMTIAAAAASDAQTKPSNGMMANGGTRLGNGKNFNEPPQQANEWLIEDLAADGRARVASEKEANNSLTKEPSQDRSEEADQSEYSSLEDDEDDDFGDETNPNDESLEEDVLDGMTSGSPKKAPNSSLLGNSKVPMRELQGTVSGCVVGGRSTTAPFSPSLFPHVPLYFSFANHLEAGPALPPCISKIMKWKLTPVTPVVVRKVLINTGFRLLKQTNDWMGVWAKHMKSPQFRTIRSYQKYNHIPGSFQIGRKDRVWRNLENQIRRNGKKEFGFMPRTYILPQDLKSLRQMWPKYSQQNVKWIIKPPASARGVGIKVVNRWSQIPKRKPIIVQRYVERPFLIQGSKFDLRLYVLVTSINPLRMYLHTDGLARFASVRYSENADTLNDRYMHLTNYSINKLSANYAKNEDADQCQGHKWTLRSLWQYLGEAGVNTEKLWGTLRNLIIRTLLAGESPINNMTKANMLSKYNCFELFGFDVLLDADLSPWLLEVNISPSLHSASPLDLRVKAPLVQAVLNTAMYQVPPKLTGDKQQELLQEMGMAADQVLCHDKRIYTTQLSREERVKHSRFVNKEMTRGEYLGSILDGLTADDVRCLINTEDELARCAPLERIFPAPNTHAYLDFTENPRYYNRLLDAWETKYSKKRPEAISLLRELCEKKVHLQVPPTNASARKASNNKPTTSPTTTTTTQNGRGALKTTSHVRNGAVDSRLGPEDDVLSDRGPRSESYRESSVESISTTTSTLSECTTSTTPSILPLSTSSSGTDATRDMVSSSFSSFASELCDEAKGRHCMNVVGNRSDSKGGL